ncbi:MAG: hypothetical protein EPO21_04310 [Chloroflexota bacterium]|nr:MAG: hypothetical protein EPO21_04310 [Chloroflexota bacterium]
MTHSTVDGYCQDPFKVEPLYRRILSNRIWRVLVGGALLALVIIAAVIYVRGVRQSATPISVLTTDDFHALAISPDDPAVVFFGHHNGLLQSIDGSRTWRTLISRRNFDVMGLAINPANPQQVYATGHYVFQVSEDGGGSWQEITHDLPNIDIHGFAMSLEDPSRLFAYVYANGLFTSADGGYHWEKLDNQLPDDVMVLAMSTRDTLFAGSMTKGLLQSSDGGLTWVPNNQDLGSAMVTGLAVDPIKPDTLYVGTGDGLYRSDDRGQKWRKLPYPGKNVAVVAVNSGEPRIVLAVEAAGPRQGLVYRSEDGGETWGDHR